MIVFVGGEVGDVIAETGIMIRAIAQSVRNQSNAEVERLFRGGIIRLLTDPESPLFQEE